MKSQKVYFSIFRLFEIKNNPFLLFDFSTVRNSQRHLFTFQLFVFRLFEIDVAWFCILSYTFHMEPCSTSFPDPVCARIFFPPSQGFFSPSMPRQFPRCLQHVKPRSCHFAVVATCWNHFYGNCIILELETDGKSSILELETFIFVGIGDFWS